MAASVWDRYGAVIVIALVVLTPLGVLTAAALSRHRRTVGWEQSWARRASIAEVGIVVGTAPWMWMILTPTSGMSALRLVPLHDIALVLGGRDSIVQMVGNLLALFAFGFWLPVRFRLARAWLVVPIVAAISACMSTLLEVLQWVFQLGRVTSVDDVLINALGGAIGAALSTRWWRSRAGDQGKAMTSGGSQS